MKEYARLRGFPRAIIPIPLLSPGLSALWLGLIAPKYAGIGRELIESLRCDTTVRNHSADGLFSVRPQSVSQAIQEAMREEISSETPSWRNWMGEIRDAVGA